MILLIDNYDSFVFNLARYFERLGQETHVVRNDAIDVAGIERLNPDALVFSPGPCSPQEAGCSIEAVSNLHAKFSILGVCLGHQAIGAALGARIVRANEPMHGRASQVFHDGDGVFSELDSPLIACRYHSLVVERASLPESLRVTASTADGTIMAIAHRQYPVIGLQFHPESILTDSGYPLLANFLRIAGISLPDRMPRIEGERASLRPEEPATPTQLVTF